VTDDGVPYWEDLYLDIIGLPNKPFEIIDRDELEQALEQKHISVGQYKLATREAESLLGLLNSGNFELLELTKHHYQKLTTNSVQVNSDD
jgi:uncharacterized protein